MKIACLFFAGLIVSGPSQAQDRSKEPQSSQSTSVRTIESCKIDIQKFCGATNLKQECLVAHWTRISNDCQDALAKPMRGGSDGAG